MDTDRRRRALGGLTLAALLIPGLAAPPAPAAPILVRPSSAVAAAELGWPIGRCEQDPAVWQSIPGVGVARASALAAAIPIAGEDALLRLPGFGIKMAAAVTARLEPMPHNTSSNTSECRQESPQ